MLLVYFKALTNFIIEILYFKNSDNNYLNNIKMKIQLTLIVLVLFSCLWATAETLTFSSQLNHKSGSYKHKVEAFHKFQT